MKVDLRVREIRHFHLFCGLGGGAKGFNKASPRVGNMVGKFRCIGGIDVDAPAIRDFERMTGTRGTVMDLFDRTAKYQALNRLTLRGVWLMLEAWADDPPELIAFENVPRIATRGRYLLDQIGELQSLPREVNTSQTGGTEGGNSAALHQRSARKLPAMKSRCCIASESKPPAACSTACCMMSTRG